MELILKLPERPSMRDIVSTIITINEIRIIENTYVAGSRLFCRRVSNLLQLEKVAL
jgi:hypothetical protein